MTGNFYTLFHLAAELERIFSGKTVDEIFTQHREELIVTFDRLPDAIIIGCAPSDNYITAVRNFKRAGRNSMAFFRSASGLKVTGISMNASDRQLDIRLDNRFLLSLRMFGPKANVLFLDENLGTTDTFLKRSAASAELRRIRPAGLTDRDALTAHSDLPLNRALKFVYPKFGTILIRELLEISALDGSSPVSELTDNEIKRLIDDGEKLTKVLLSSPSPRIYMDGDVPVLFSIIPLRHLADHKFIGFEFISEAVQRFRKDARRRKEFLKKREEISGLLEKERDKTERTLMKISAESAAPFSADMYEKYGKLLMTALHTVKKGDKTASVADFLDGSGSPVCILLDPRLTPSKNAELYFEKGKRLRNSEEEKRLRAGNLRRELDALDNLLGRFEDAITEEELNRFIEENQKFLSRFGLRIKRSGELKKEEASPFRIFRVAGDFQVWAGKSSENNDLLTTRHTAKNDLWFHVRGVGGSHVVLKTGTGKGEVSREAIEQAAGIAAYYSKMRKSKLVPVTMCEGKYVRKPKGVPPGTVFVEREKTIYAVPALPQL